MLVRYVVEESVNGPIVHGKAAIVAIKPSPIIAINEPVFPRVLILCLVNVDLAARLQSL